MAAQAAGHTSAHSRQLVQASIAAIIAAGERLEALQSQAASIAALAPTPADSRASALMRQAACPVSAFTRTIVPSAPAA